VKNKTLLVVIVVVVLLAAGGYVLRDRIGGMMGSSAGSSSGASDAAATAADGPIVPPAVASREALTQEVAAIETRLMAAAQKSAGSDSASAPTQLERLFDGLRELHGQLPRDHFDPAAIVKTVGREPRALTQWINDHTSLVPYRGTLRGAVGVLMDRRGNSLDRALLLDALLRAAGKESRVARSRVDGAPLDALVAAASRPLLPIPGSADTAPDAEKPEDIVKRAGVDPTAVAADQAALRSARRKLGEDTAARAKAQAATLLSAVTPHMAPPSLDEAAWRRDSLADHWFVQYREDGDWIDVDAIPGRATFEPIAAATDTFEASELPEDLQHRVRVRVVAEYWKDGRLETQVPLDHTFAPSNVFGQSVTLQTLPTNWPDDAALRKVGDPQRAISEAALAQKSWTPMLVIGAQPTLSHSFTDDGRLIDPFSADDTTAQLGRAIGEARDRAVGGATDLLGSLPSGDKPEPKAPAASPTSPVLTAQWIEYEILSPGLPPEAFKRDVFDVLPPGQRAAPNPPRPNLSDRDRLRRGLALINEIELLPLGTQLHQEYVIALRSSRLQAARGYVLQAAKQAGQIVAPPAGLQPMPGPLMDVAVARGAWSGAANQIYFDRPNLFGRWRTFHLQDEQQGGRIVAREATDIIANYLAVHGSDQAAAFRTRVEQGVLDTNVEMVMMSACPTCAITRNAAHLFGLAAERKETWTTITPGQRPADSAALTPAVRARINDQSAGGAIVVFGGLPGGADTAWWAVDPKSGRALGIGADGLGQVQTEHILLKTAITYYGCNIVVFIGIFRGHPSGAAVAAGFASCAIGGMLGAAGWSYAGATAVEGTAAIIARLDWASVLLSTLGGIITATL
jgi:hypothetical protein